MAIGPGQFDDMQAALGKAELASNEAQRLADNVNDGFSWLIGASSSAAAAHEDARQSLSLFTALQGKLERMRANPDKYGDADVVDFLQAAKADTQNSALKEASHLLTVGAAVDATTKVPAGFKWSAILVVLALIAVYAFFRGRGGRA